MGARAWGKQGKDAEEIDRRLKKVYGDSVVTKPSAPGKPSRLAQCYLAVRTLKKEAPASVMVYLRKHHSKTQPATNEECSAFLDWQKNAPRNQRKLALMLMDHKLVWADE